MISKTSLLGNATPLLLPLHVTVQTSVAFLIIQITCGLAPVLVLRIIRGLETQMETEYSLTTKSFFVVLSWPGPYVSKTRAIKGNENLQNEISPWLSSQFNWHSETESVGITKKDSTCWIWPPQVIWFEQLQPLSKYATEVLSTSLCSVCMHAYQSLITEKKKG